MSTFGDLEFCKVCRGTPVCSHHLILDVPTLSPQSLPLSPRSLDLVDTAVTRYDILYMSAWRKSKHHTEG